MTAIDTGRIRRWLQRPLNIAPLAVFRMLFGAVMLWSILRFMLKGWIHQLYVEPAYFFTYYGFDWVQPLGETGMWLLFSAMAVAAVCISLGLYFRLAALIFFLLFTYVELIDKTNYLNHYYFVSLVSLLLALSPAHRFASLDVLRRPDLRLEAVPRWVIGAFRLQLGLVYVYAGIAKLNPDWLFEAQPLRIWLLSQTELPLIGWIFSYRITPYLFSWLGALYDLSIPFFLLIPRTRPVAYLAVIAFHLMTALLFNIGMFPWIMILCTLVFFPADWHAKNLRAIGKRLGIDQPRPETSLSGPLRYRRPLMWLLGGYFVLQLLLPWRFLLYPGELFWTEQGYRFSWRVMLIEKGGITTFRVHDPESGRSWEVENSRFLTPYQEKMMSTQPDMILQYAHHLADVYAAEQQIAHPEVYVDCFVSLNGRRSRRYIDPAVNLAAQRRGFHHKSWVLPLEAPPEKHYGHARR
jgi:hypothetical protein